MASRLVNHFAFSGLSSFVSCDVSEIHHGFPEVLTSCKYPWSSMLMFHHLTRIMFIVLEELQEQVMYVLALVKVIRGAQGGIRPPPWEFGRPKFFVLIIS